MALHPETILAYKGIEVPNPVNQLAQFQQFQANALKLQEAQSAAEERNALRGLNPSSPDYENQLFRLNPQLGIQYRKERIAAEQVAATTEKTKMEVATKTTESFRDLLQHVKTPEQAAQWVQAQYSNPYLGPVVSQVPLQQALGGIPTDPKALETWKNQNAVGMTDWVKRNTMTAAERAADARARERLDLDRQRETRLSQGPIGTTLTPEQNNALFGENGAVAQGKINPNRINSRNAKMWADAFINNPNSDPVKVAQDVAAADKAIKDFGTGEQGKKITAFNTAIDHLDTLDKLGAALNSGDIKLFNSIANSLGIQTGQSAATMYNQAARIVGGEVSKAIVPGVGTGKEREETAAAFSSAMSPEQLVGASATAKKLLGGQLGSLELQYKRTTKRNDFADQFLSPASRAAYQSTRAAPAAAPSSSTRAVTRTGTLNGRKVIEYSDGSIDYAD